MAGRIENTNPAWFSRAKSIGTLVLLFVATAYLMLLFFAALDSIAFQQRVLKLVGGADHDHARVILTKLDELREQKESDDRFPHIGTIALQLDRVKANADAIFNFNNVVVVPDADDSIPLSELGIQVSNNVDALGSAIEKVEPAVGITRHLVALEHSVVELLKDPLVIEAGAKLDTESVFSSEITADANTEEAVTQANQTSAVGANLPSSGFAGGMIDGREGPDAAVVRLESSILAVGNSLSALQRTIAVDDSSHEAVDAQMNEMNTAVADLHTVVDRSPNEVVKDLARLDQPVRQLLKSLVEARSEIERASSNLAEVALSDLDQSAEELRALIANLAAEIENSELDWMQEPKKKASGQEKTAQQFAASAAALRAEVGKLIPDIDQFENLTSMLSEMQIASGAFDKASINTKDINVLIDGELHEGETAAGLFKQNVQRLQNAIDGMNSALGGVTKRGQIAQLLPDGVQVQRDADVILSDYDSFDRFDVLSWLPFDWGIDPKRLAVASRHYLDIMLVLVVGAIGSIIYLVQYVLRMMLQGDQFANGLDRPLSWFFFRPVFGAIVAFAVYLLYQTGQVALGAGGIAAALENGVNIPFVTVIALFAGLLSWQTLDLIQSKGERWLDSHKRSPLWATGLSHALDAKGHTVESCAQHVARSVDQVDRWLHFRDMVTPEMQDRLSTWLDCRWTEVFSKFSPIAKAGHKPMFARGLQPYLNKKDAAHHEVSIAAALRVPPAVVESWRDGKRPVPSEHQWSLLELVGGRYAEFYEAQGSKTEYWAYHLREAMAESEASSEEVSTKLNVSTKLVREWRELDKAVPEASAEAVAEAVSKSIGTLYKTDFDRNSDAMIATDKLRPAIIKNYKEASNDDDDAAIVMFAKSIDVEKRRVDDWIERRKDVFEPTSLVAARLLNEEHGKLFEKRAS